MAQARIPTLTPSVIKKAEVHLSAADPRFKALLERVGSCTLKRSPNNSFPVLLRSIISQQLSNKAADTIESRLFQLVGTQRVTPHALSQISVEQLRAVGLSAKKVHYIQTLSNAVVTKELQLEDFRQYDDEQVIGTLTHYPGIGRWTAEMFLIFALGRTDVLAVGDLGLKRGIKILYDLAEKPSNSEFEEMSQPWRPYRTVASWYLWRVID